MKHEDYKQVKKIFKLALNLVPEERMAFLDKECLGNEALRCEVEELLESYDSKFMEEPAIAQVDEVFVEDKAEDEPTKLFSVLETGRQLGHFKIISKIAKGGMGEVYLAEDTKLDRKVAIKFLNAKYSEDAEKLKRFIQEAKAVSALNHPNILTVHEIGEFEGTNFIATEFIEGQTLREHLESGRMSFDEILMIGIQTAEGLSAAHQAGIIHRDIKPENIMIRRDGYVKILDFGLAKIKEKKIAASEREQVTKKMVKTDPGVVMGTIAYMSPEQARGKDIDARSDVFSFGVVLYESLTGRLPFEGETMADKLAAIINSDPSPMINFAPHLPKQLQRIVGKTLRKKRDQRYQSTRDLLIDLKNLREELQLEAKLEQTAVPGKPETIQTGGPRVAATSGSVKDTLLLTEFENTTGEAIFDQTLKVALAFSLAQSPFLEILPETKVRETLSMTGRSSSEPVTKELGYEICIRRGLKAYITGSISRLGKLYVLTLEAINASSGESLGREFEQISSKEEVLTALGRAATGLREKLGESLSSIQKYGSPVDYATTSSLEALKFFTLGHEQRTLGRELESIPFYKKALEFDTEFASAYLALAAINVNTNQWEQATEFIVKAYDLRDGASESEKLLITHFYYKYVTGEIDKAIDTVILWRKTIPSEVGPLIVLSHNLERVGQSEKAVAAARKAVRLDSNNAIPYMNLAESLLSLGRYAQVKEVCQEAFDRRLGGGLFHIFLFIVAFIEGDAATMTEHLKWFGGRSDKYLAIDLQTRSAAFQGQRRKSQDFARRAIGMASRNDVREVAAKYAAEQALRIVFWSSGEGLPTGDDTQLKAVLKTQITNALKLSDNRSVLALIGIVHALSGDSEEAELLISELKRKHPKDTLLNELWLPTIRAALKLQNGRAAEAIEELESAERFEPVGEFYPQYLRALAYFKLNKMKDSVREFEKILNHRGQAPLSSLYALAQLGKARAAKAKEEYEKFFEMWKDADKDLPFLIEAKREYEDLN